MDLLKLDKLFIVTKHWKKSIYIEFVNTEFRVWPKYMYVTCILIV